MSPAHRFAFLFILSLACVSGASAQEWTPVTQELLKAEKTGFGGLCGVVVERTSGELIVDLSDRGLFRSSDRGQTWKPIGEPFKGRTEWPGCMMLDPLGGKELLVALVYGPPVFLSPDLGATGTFLDAKSKHVDWCVRDWKGGQFLLAFKHEAGGLVIASRDGGKSFQEIGKGFASAWIFDDRTALLSQAKSKDNPLPKILRTSDGAMTFEPVGQYHARALPRWRDGALYWVVDDALLRTTDQGRTWQKLSEIKDGRCGPVFGKRTEQMFVLTGKGIRESRDGGVTWEPPIAVPAGMKGLSTLAWIEFDPVHDDLYVMKMSSDLYRLPRGGR